MTDFALRPAEPDDRHHIRRLLRQLHAERAGSATLPEVRQGSRTFLATDAGTVIGLIAATFVDNGIEAYGMIDDLVVDQDHRGRRIGTALLEECRRWLVSHDVQVTFVSALDEDAAEFYVAAGFTRCSGPWLWESSRRNSTDPIG